jgi:hypothetical protein
MKAAMMKLLGIQNLFRGLAFLLVASLLAGCIGPDRGLREYVETMKREDPQFYAELERERIQRRSERTEVLRVSITCFNHGNYGATHFAVEEVAHGQISRGMVGGPFGCGGVLALGYPVPLKWRPGLKVKVTWNTYAPGASEPTRHEKTTTILPYDKVGSVYVHFFPGDQVRIAVSAYYGVGHPLHPIAEYLLVPPPEIE